MEDVSPIKEEIKESENAPQSSEGQEKVEEQEKPSEKPDTENEDMAAELRPEQIKQKKLPLCLIVMGMAGSGKTTFVQVSQLNQILEAS